jgi:hypothetical protein
VATSIRQTNVIWTLFIAILAGVTIMDPRSKSPFSTRTLGSFRHVGDLVKFLGDFITACVTSLPILLPKLWAFVLVFLGFACFIVINGGIVLGMPRY